MFTEGVANLVKSVVLEQLASWLKTNKGVDVTIDEMVAALALPVNVTPRVVSNYTQPLPSALNGTTAKPRATKKVAGDPAHPCQYLFKRGQNAGKTCGQPSVPGTDYCSACSKKSSVKNLQAGTSKAPVVTRVKASQPPPSEIPAEELGDGRYLDRTNKFILTVPENGVTVAVGKMDGDVEQPLSTEDEQRATALGYSLQPKVATVAPIPTTQTKVANFARPPLFAKPKMPVLN